MLRVVASVLTVVCKSVQQLPTILGPAVYRGKTMCNVRGWPQQCRNSGANGPNIVALPFGDYVTTEISGADWFQTLRNDSQQHAITFNRVCKRTQHLTFNIVESCWPDEKLNLYIFSNIINPLKLTHG